MFRTKKEKPFTRLCYLAELTIEEGLHLTTKEACAKPLFLFGERIQRDHKRFAVIQHHKHNLKCCFCGIEATKFIITKHRNDKVMPFSINIYAGEVMLTWDHILPRSHGGSDHVLNSRIACAPCNERRGNKLTLDDVAWALKQPMVIFRGYNSSVRT